MAIESTTDSFEHDVLQHSRHTPVVVDFWAPWCGPCRALTPILEKLAAEFNGRFLLAKVNIEEHPQLASAFGVQSIPYVMAVRDGQVADAFLGALPEASIRAWLERLLPSPADLLAAEGKALTAQDAAGGEEKFRAALAVQPGHAAATIGLAGALLAQDRREEAAKLIEDLEQRGFLEPEAERLKAELAIMSAAAAAGGVEAARAAAEAEPGNTAWQLAFAEALAAERRYREALDVCLSLIEHDKAGSAATVKDAALRILSLAGSDPELADEYRRKLASALY